MTTAITESDDPRTFARDNHIPWRFVCRTQGFVDAIHSAGINNRAAIQRIVDGLADPEECVKPLLNAEALGISGIDDIAHIRHDLIQCLCGVRLDSTSGPDANRAGQE